MELLGDLNEARNANIDHSAWKIVGIQKTITIIITTFIALLPGPGNFPLLYLLLARFFLVLLLLFYIKS